MAVSDLDLQCRTPSGVREPDLVTMRPGMVFEAARSARDDLEVRRAVDTFPLPLACDSSYPNIADVQNIVFVNRELR